MFLPLLASAAGKASNSSDSSKGNSDGFKSLSASSPWESSCFLFVCSSSSHSCPYYAAINVSLPQPPISHHRGIFLNPSVKGWYDCSALSCAPLLWLQCATVICTDSITQFLLLPPEPFPASFVWSQQEQMEMKRFSMLSKRCLLCML